MTLSTGTDAGETMNENAKKWIKALRSGKYKQARRQLARGEGEKRRYCCLGVACELYKREHPGFRYDDEGGSLPNVVQKWLGLETFDGLYRRGTRASTLVGANDSARNFEKIAAIIEEQPPGLFRED